jgi:hypothetical protein
MSADDTLHIGLLGLPVMEAPLLPSYADPGETARRIVRHGLADVLSWLGEDAGPEPALEATHMIVIENEHLGRRALVSPMLLAELKAWASSCGAYPHRFTISMAYSGDSKVEATFH